MSLSDENKDLLIEMIRDRGMSYRQVAAHFGITKSSAVGYGSRAGLKGKSRLKRFGQTRGVLETVVKPSVRLVPPAPRPKKPRQETEIVTREVVESRRSYDVATNKILSLTFRWTEEDTPTAVCWDCFVPSTMCHWPVRSSPFQFCGAPKPDDEKIPYCARHMRMAISVRQ